MFAVATHSRLRSPGAFPAMLRATLSVRRDLARTRGLLRVANAIAGPTELFTFTIWETRDAMLEFMRSGAHQEVMWRWPQWLSAFWLARLAPSAPESGAWRGLVVGRVAARRGTAHPEFVPPAFASREPRPRDLTRRPVGASISVVRPDHGWRWPAALAAHRRDAAWVDRAPGLLMRARGWSLDGELVTLAFWRDAEAAARAVETCGPRSGLAVWAMAWRPLDEFGTWDGRRLRVLLSERASDDDPEP